MEGDANEYEEGREETDPFFIPLKSYMSFVTEKMSRHLVVSQHQTVSLCIILH